MIHKTCAVYDHAASAFMLPFQVPRDAVAVRAFTDAVNSKAGHPMSEHPEDYTLFLIGEFDDSKGEHRNILHEKLATGLSVLRRSPPDLSETELEV